MIFFLEILQFMFHILVFVLLELIIVEGMKFRSQFFILFFAYDIQLIQHHLLKRLFLLHSTDFAYLSKVTQYICVDLFLGSCFIPLLHCLPSTNAMWSLSIVVTQQVLNIDKNDLSHFILFKNYFDCSFSRHTNFSRSLLMSTKALAKIFVGISLQLQIHFKE